MRRIEVGLAVLLVGAGLLSLALQRWVFVDPTNERDWAAAAEYVLPELGDDDVFRIEPWWQEAALTHFTSAGSQAERTRTPLVEDLYPYDTIWIVAENSRLDEGIAAIPKELRGSVGDTKRFGSVSVAPVEVVENVVEWEMLENLDEVEVSRIKGDAVEKCGNWSVSSPRWDCGSRQRWLYVGEALHEVGDEPRRTIWAHPLDGGRTLRLETEVPGGDLLRVRASFDLRAARLPRTGEVMLRVWVGDELVEQRLIEHDDHSYAPVDVDISDHQPPVPLRIEIELRGSIKDRFFFVNAWSFAATPN